MTYYKNPTKPKTRKGDEYQMTAKDKAKECALKQAELIQSAVEDLQSELSTRKAEGKRFCHETDSCSFVHYAKALKILSKSGLLD